MLGLPTAILLFVALLMFSHMNYGPEMEMERQRKRGNSRNGVDVHKMHRASQNPRPESGFVKSQA